MSDQVDQAFQDCYTIKIHWNPETQDVAFQFETQEFKKWPFAISVLDMAKEAMKQAWMQSVEMEKVQALMEGQRQASLQQQIQKQLRRQS